jgi:hypothetical protein
MFRASFPHTALPAAIAFASLLGSPICCLAAGEAAPTALSAPAITAASTREFGFAFEPAEFAELALGGPAPASLMQVGAKGLVLQSRSTAGSGAFYVFHDPNNAAFHATLLLNEGRLTGVIDHPGDMRTTVTSIRAGVSSARVENAINDLPCGCSDKHLSPDLNGQVVIGGGDGGVAGGPCDDGSKVDVLVVYTNAAVAQAGSETSLLDSIDWAIADSNAIYAGSGVSLQARLVGTSRLTTYVENADMEVDLDRLTDPTDGIIDDIHALRDAVGADLVAMVRAEGGGACGVAWLMPNNTTASADLGFSVTALDCFPNRTFTHELGHNMGCCHAQGDGGGCVTGGIFSYSLGNRFFGTDGQQYRTVMAYLPGTRIPRFSSPSVLWAGTATGIANQRDNARTINETRLAFSNYRCSADGSGNCGGTGNCYAPHGGQGCSVAACCEAVCAKDPFCCSTSWDELCASTAVEICTACGEPSAGSCFTPHFTASCDDAACCATVCAADPFCCNVQWDAICATGANTLCPNCGDPETGSCYTAHGTPFCDDASCCDLVCSTDPFCCDNQWDSVCVTSAIANCPGCGNPSAGDCYAERSTPYCADLACCETVCAADPFCCSTAWDSFCATRAISDCPGCGNPSNSESCYVVHATPYCNDAVCCAAVCDLDPFCCESNWDQFCVNSAAANCPGCDNPSNGSCYAAHPTPHCNKPSCCDTVCAADPFCCSTAWDVVCVNAAIASCPGCDNPSNGDCYTTHPTPYCNKPECCTTVCAADPFCCSTAWDSLCVNAAITNCPSCDNPSNGDCLVAHPTPFCNTPECCSTVCAADPLCCDNQWDSFCVAGANTLCVETCGGSLAPSCCTAHGGTHCNDAACCTAVCAVDPFCCNTQWDTICANRAITNCAVCAPQCPADLNGDGTVGAQDLAGLLNAWGTANAAADLNNDGIVGAQDLAALLNAWGPC